MYKIVLSVNSGNPYYINQRVHVSINGGDFEYNSREDAVVAANQIRLAIAYLTNAGIQTYTTVDIDEQ